MIAKKSAAKRVCTLVLFFAAIPFVFAHGNILYDVNLDFEPEVKQQIITTAQRFLKINETPARFDYERELIIVQFNRSRELSVYIKPDNLRVHGFRDDTLRTLSPKDKIPLATRKEIAQKIFDGISPSYKTELVYDTEKKLYAGTYKHTWYRYIDGIYISNDLLEVEIDPQTGHVIAWKLTPFFYPKELMKLTPAITGTVAQKIAELTLHAQPLDIAPVLIIENTVLVWIVKVKGLYPIYAAINALDGKVLYSGGLKTELPETYKTTISKKIEVGVK